MFLYRKHIKKLWTIKYICQILVIIKIKNNLNLYQILSTTNIFPISWGGLDKGGTGQRVLRYIHKLLQLSSIEVIEIYLEILLKINFYYWNKMINIVKQVTVYPDYK